MDHTAACGAQKSGLFGFSSVLQLAHTNLKSHIRLQRSTNTILRPSEDYSTTERQKFIDGGLAAGETLPRGSAAPEATSLAVVTA